MRVIKKLLKASYHIVVGMSLISGFFLGAIFSETVIDKSGPPTALTYFLAR